MKYKVFSVFDMATEAFTTPFFLTTEPEAIRVFSDHVNTEGSPPNKHPGDYHLYIIGEFTDHNADMRKQTPEVLISAIEVLDKGK